MPHQPLRTRAILLLLVALLAWPFSALAQDGDPATEPGAIDAPLITTLRFGHLTPSQGLSGNHIEAILQDSRGFMWFGTWDGLDRYDGYEFTSYRHDPGDPTTISGNVIRGLLEDRDGAIWVATRESGLNRFDPLTQRFTRFQYDAANPNSLSNAEILALGMDGMGAIWVCMANGDLDRFDPQTQGFVAYRAQGDGGGMLRGPVRQTVTAPDGVLWMAGSSLRRFDPATGQMTLYEPDKKAVVDLAPAAGGPPGGGPSGGPPNGGGPSGGPPPAGTGNPGGNPGAGGMQAAAIYRDGAGNLWLGGKGLFKFDPRTEAWTAYQRDGLDVHGIYGDQSGMLWISTTTGLDQFNPQTGAFIQHFTQDPLNLDSLNDQVLTAIYASAEGVLWIGSVDGGVNTLNLRQTRFRNYRYDPLNTNRFSSRRIAALAQDRQGALWVGAGQTIDRFDPASGEIAHFKLPASAAPATGRPEARDIYSILEEDDGMIWFDGPGGVTRLDPKTGEFKVFQPPPMDNGQAISVWSLVRDGQGGFWFGSDQQGLYHFDPRSEAFVNYRRERGKPDAGPGSDHVMALARGAAGDLWVGSDGGFLSHFEAGRFEVFQRDPASADTVPAGRMTAMLIDRAGDLWIGATDGLYRFDRQARAFKRYTEADGLPSSTVNAILEDAAGQLWLGTLRGVARFDPATGAFKRYGGSDGLAGGEVNPAAATVGAGGELFFGSNAGITAFDPAAITDSDFMPPVLLTDFRLFNQPVAPDPQGVLPVPIWDAALQKLPLTLRHDQGVVSFEFAALGYAAPEKTRYRYILEGFDPDWNEVDSTRRFASYTNPPAGTYTFRVQATNSDGIWSAQEAALPLTVLPPWWETWWFRGLAIAAVLGLAFAVYWWRIYAMRQRNLQLEAEVSARTQDLLQTNQLLQEATGEAERAREAAESANQAKSTFLANMSHELRSPLNAILGFAQVLARHPGLDPDTQENVGIIRRSGEHLLTLINQVLDLSKIEANQVTLSEKDFDLHRLLDDLEDMFSLKAEDKQLQLIIEHGDEVPRFVRTDEIKLRQVLINLISNAVKFTEEGGVAVRCAARAIEAGGQDGAAGLCRLLFEVEDSGPGIAAEEMDMLFEAFAQTATGRDAQEGTGLGLPISRRFVQLMGGAIEVSSAVGEGTVFRFDIGVKLAESAAAAPLPAARKIVGLAPGQPRYRILVVDDKWNNRQLLLKLLGPLGFDVREAENGQEAVRIWGEWDPHLIWMDMRMPVMNGYEAAKRIRSSTRGQAVAIIALTASTLEEERAIVLSAGCDEFLRKPFREASIFEVMHKQIGVEYLYEEPATLQERAAHKWAPDGQRGEDLTGEDLMALPFGWRADLLKATAELDIDAMARLITAIRPAHPAVASALDDLIGDFAYERLTGLLEAAMEMGHEP